MSHFQDLLRRSHAKNPYYIANLYQMNTNLDKGAYPFLGKQPSDKEIGEYRKELRKSQE